MPPSHDLGRWQPLGRAEVAGLFEQLGAPWWFAGGHALELFVGRSWRAHDDIDVGIRRMDLSAAWATLEGWETFVASRGALSPWRGEVLTAEHHQNNVWVRCTGGPWCMDITIGAGDDSRWIYRRNPALTIEWDRAVLRSADGLPYLAPELQLLFKSTNARPKDDVDAEVVIPLLDDNGCDLLRTWLQPDHRWHRLLDGSAT